MSLLVPEFAWTLDRIVCIAPTEDELQSAFERMGFHLTTILQPSEPVELAQARWEEGRVRSWLSFRLGRRSGLEARFCLLGVPCAKEAPSTEFLEQCEGILWFVDPAQANSDHLLRVKLGATARAKPQVFVGLGGAGDSPPDLRGLAIDQWARSFPQALFVKSPEKFLGEGLDWLLSF